MNLNLNLNLIKKFEFQNTQHGGLGIINLTRQYNTERPTLESYLLKYMYITCVLNELHFFMQEFENKVCWIDRFLLQMSPATENRHSMSTKPADIPRKC